MRVYAFVFLLLLSGCATAPRSAPFQPGEIVYLAGPEKLIEYPPDPERDAFLKQHPDGIYISGGVALGWFDRVQVIEDKAGVVKFSRSMARHEDTLAQAPESAFRSDSDFKRLDSWPKPGTYGFCDKQQRCFELHIDMRANFHISQPPHPDTYCDLVQTDDFNKCHTEGHVFAAPGYLEFKGDHDGFEDGDDIKDFFVDYGYGNICRIGFSTDFFDCDPKQVKFIADEFVE